jgi:hypothetical protein
LAFRRNQPNQRVPVFLSLYKWLNLIQTRIDDKKLEDLIGSIFIYLVTQDRASEINVKSYTSLEFALFLVILRPFSMQGLPLAFISLLGFSAIFPPLG